MSRNIGYKQTATTDAANGMWDLRQQLRYERGESWPSPPAFFSYYDRADSASTIVTLPSTLPDNGIMIWRTTASRLGASTSPGISPSGWSEIGSFSELVISSYYVSNQYFYKKIESGDESRTLSGIPFNSAGASNRVVIFSYPDAITSLSLQSVTKSYTNDEPGTQTITASGGTVPLLAFVGTSSSGGYSQDVSASMTEDTTDLPGFAFAYQIFDSGDTPVNLTSTKTDSGNRNENVTFYIEVS